MARIAGYLFGGKYFWNSWWNGRESTKKNDYDSENIYDFEPDEKYSGEFSNEENIVLEPVKKSQE